MTGMWLAIHHPGRLSTLILSNCVPHIGNIDAWNARIETATKDGMLPLAVPSAERWFKPDFRVRAPDRFERMVNTFIATPPEGYAACCALLRDTDLADAVRSISVPTLIIAATHDQATPPQRCRELAASVPGAEYIELDAAHMSNWEAPGLYSHALIRFTKSHISS